MTSRVAILISGGGSNMVALVRSMQGDHPGRPCVVLSDKADAAGLGKATAMGIPTATIEAATDKKGFEKNLNRLLDEAQPDVICLAGFMRVLSPEFVARWKDRVLNIHPSLLPKYRGLGTHARAIAAGDEAHGCSVHLVTAQLDGGPVLGQARLAIDPDDTPETLAARVLDLEHRLYPTVLERFLRGQTGLVTLG